jgi:hypothetical protein
MDFFLNEKLMYVVFSDFQISFPMFLNNLLCKKTSYCNCNRHLMFLSQECDILLLNEKLLINFQKCYIKSENVFSMRYIPKGQIFSTLIIRKNKNIILNPLLIFTVNCKK